MIFDFYRVTPKSRKVKLKKPRGVLFSNPNFVKKNLFYTASNLLVVCLLYLAYLYWPLVQAVGRYNFYKNVPTASVETQITPIPTPTLTPVNLEEFSITIPKIFAYSQIEENVSPYNPEEYLKVLDGNMVAMAKNSSYPGSGLGNSTYIFAHSTQQSISMVRKNSVFYLLGELNNGDEIYINHDGVIYKYRVYNQLVVGANQIEYITYRDPNREMLILQTCWPIGTNWKRLLVFAEMVDK